MIVSSNEFNDQFSFVTTYIKKDELDAFLQFIKIVKVDNGDVIIHDGEPSSTLYFVKSGSLLTYIEENGEVIEIGKINPGEYTGEISFYDKGIATASVKAIEPCTLFTLSREDFSSLEEKHPNISSNLLRSISNLIINRTLTTSGLLFDGIADKNNDDIENNDSASLSDWLVSIYGSLKKH